MTDQSRPSDPAPYDIESDAGAPLWARKLFEDQQAARGEYKAQLDRIERNLETNYKETRRLSKRVNDHENDLEEVRDRLDDLEAWRTKLERSGT